MLNLHQILYLIVKIDINQAPEQLRSLYHLQSQLQNTLKKPKCSYTFAFYTWSKGSSQEELDNNTKTQATIGLVSCGSNRPLLLIAAFKLLLPHERAARILRLHLYLLYFLHIFANNNVSVEFPFDLFSSLNAHLPALSDGERKESLDFLDQVLA